PRSSARPSPGSTRHRSPSRSSAPLRSSGSAAPVAHPSTDPPLLAGVGARALAPSNSPQAVPHLLPPAPPPGVRLLLQRPTRPKARLRLSTAKSLPNRGPRLPSSASRASNPSRRRPPPSCTAPSARCWLARARGARPSRRAGCSGRRRLCPTLGSARPSSQSGCQLRPAAARLRGLPPDCKDPLPNLLLGLPDCGRTSAQAQSTLAQLACGAAQLRGRLVPAGRAACVPRRMIRLLAILLSKEHGPEVKASVLVAAIGALFVFFMASAFADGEVRRAEMPLRALLGSEAYEALAAGEPSPTHYLQRPPSPAWSSWLSATPRQSRSEDRLVPQFSLQAQDGSTWRSSDKRGKVLILNFWTVTCQPCLEEMPSLLELGRILEGRDDVELVLVSTDRDWDTVRTVIADDAPVTSLLDPD